MEIRPGFNGSKYSGYFQGSGLDHHNLYRLDIHNNTQYVMELDITGKGPIWHGTTGVIVQTEEGERTMIWNAWNNHAHMGAYKKSYGSFVLLSYPHPFALQKDDPNWGKTRENLHLKIDLEDALRLLEPNNHIRSVSYFIYGASTLIDNITFSSR